MTDYQWADTVADHADSYAANAEFPGGHDYYGKEPSAYAPHTGDPRVDLEYERQQAASGGQPSVSNTMSQFDMPVQIQNFFRDFNKAVCSKNVHQIRYFYDTGFPELSHIYYSNTPWPDFEQVAHFVPEGSCFNILYKELYYRHLYAKVTSGPSLEQRLSSYFNYCELFNMILNRESPVDLVLPQQWLWDIIDEFIYQFQNFTYFRSKSAKLQPEDIEALDSNPNVWNIHSVLNVLHSLVDKSNIRKQLEVHLQGGDMDTVAGEFGIQDLYKWLGLYSLIGLLRVHVLLGDYHTALKCVELVNYNRPSPFMRVPACLVTTSYYVGFSYLMMRRYQDAIRTFVVVLLYIQRNKHALQNRAAAMYDVINKQNDQMYLLLALCMALYPTRIDENVDQQLQERFGDKRARLSKWDVNEFENCFSMGCPRFISPALPNYSEITPDWFREPFMVQLHAFLDEVHQQSFITELRSYLKLYTTLPVAKLAEFMNIDQDELRGRLMCYKHKSRNFVWNGSTNGLDGTLQTTSEVDFYIDRDMIHIADTKVARKFGDFFIKQILKLQEMNANLERLTLPPGT